MLIYKMLEQHRDSEKDAIVAGKYRISYKELSKRCRSISTSLMSISTLKILIFLPNGIEYVVAYFSVLYSGKTVVPMSIHAKQSEFQTTMYDCGITHILTDDQYKNKAMQLCANKSIKIIDISLLYTVINESWEPPHHVEDLALLVNTSATTGNPKRVMLTNMNIWSQIECWIPVSAHKKDSVALIALPLTGIMTNSQFLQLIYLGATIVFYEGIFNADKFFQIIEKEKITCFTCTPPMALIISRYNLNSRYDIDTLKSFAVGGASAPIPVMEQLVDKYPGINFSVGYGLTETSSAISVGLFKKNAPHCRAVGKPIPGITVEVMLDGRSARTGEPGEIVVSGTTITQGYYKNEEGTKVILKDGKIYTGDIGKFDNEGYLYILGRKKNMINVGGLSVFPEEVEEILLLHPKVIDARVFSEPDDLLSEIIVAEVITADKLDEFEVRRHCKKMLTNHKVPRKIYFVDNIVISEAGKKKR